MATILHFGLEPDNIGPGTQATVAQPDIKDVIAAAQTGDVNVVAGAVDTFKDRALASLSNPMILGPMAIVYALKGKLSPFERGILGIVGAFTLFNFAKTKVGGEKPWQQQFLTQSNQGTPSLQSQQQSSEILADGQKSIT